MTCNACGEKPKNTAKDFTKAVIEINNPETLVLLRKVVIPASMGTEEQVPPVIGKYHNVILYYEANKHTYLYSSDGIPTAITAKIPQEVLDSIEELEDDVVDLQEQIDDLKNSPDVVDIVATYADLQAYDTSRLGDNDIVRVLADETHDGDSTYYRWDKQTETWTYIGGISIIASTVFYADKSENGDTRHIYKDEGLTEAATVQDLLDADEKGQVILRKVLGTPPSLLRYVDMHLLYVSYAFTWSTYGFLFSSGGLSILSYAGDALSSSTYHYGEFIAQRQLTAGQNITISTNNEISATDTTYTHFTGATASTDGTQGLVPGPLAGDEGKFLKADGTWDAVQAGPTVVQAIGTSTTDVMSQKAVTDAVATAGEGLTTLSYGTSTWQDFLTAYNAGKIVYCRASSNSNPATGSQTRMAFMAYTNNPTSPTEVEFQYVRSVSTKTAAQQTDQVFVYKLTSASGGTWTVATRDMAAEVVAGTNMTSSYSNGTLTLNATQPTVNDSTVTVTNNGTSKGSFTTNQSAAGTVALDYPEITMTTTDPGEGGALAANNFIAVYDAS